MQHTAPASPPQNVTATVLSSTEIQVNWIEVLEIDQNGIITEYEVMYEPLMNFDGQITTLTVNTTNLSITLMDLEEYVEYNISVRAYTSVGPGPYSVGIVRRTFQDGKTLKFIPSINLLYPNVCTLAINCSVCWYYAPCVIVTKIDTKL